MDQPGAVPGTFGRRSLRMALIAGAAAAGNHTVTGIKTADQLVGVLMFHATQNTPIDLTAQFSITAANTINNTGGTAPGVTAVLQVLYFAAMPEP